MSAAKVIDLAEIKRRKAIAQYIAYYGLTAGGLTK